MTKPDELSQRAPASSSPDDLYEAMRCAPSTRYFTAEPVPRDVLERVFDNARFAPNGGNRQGWRVVVVVDQDTRRRLRDLYLEHWNAYMLKIGGRAALDAGEGGEQAGGMRMLRSADDFARNLDQVPVQLVVGVDLSALTFTDSELERPSIVGGSSIYPFIQNLVLGLRHEGLGAAFTTLLVPAEKKVRALLGMPEEVVLAGQIAVGYRADPWPKQLRRNPVDQFVFADRYGKPF